VLLIGEEEMNSGRITLKNMVSGEQQKLDIDTVVKELNT
jgi:histidyl-tRNA synthetase